ncbi:hypothetical protein ACFQZ4_44975 [Catellatospora coxensis]|uniref:Uncharacterized protein n=1 Tax=Catellatospora coxensis TaxID=310354 RepID=A0A8J3P550_9ACTN|nr:hypothetical protein [Catellatospora coxensis]GIG04039.1 hypothetical protein Cco03nite_07390 [Catellatospora coxensis]
MGRLPDEPRLPSMSPVPAAERNDYQGSRALTAVKALAVATLLGVIGYVVFMFVALSGLLKKWVG